MKQLQIDADKAKQLYPNASPEFKVMLEDSFSANFFKGEITDRIKTYEDACAELGVKPEDDALLIRLGYTKDEIAYRKLKVIAKALNEGWKPNWSDSDEWKYYPWFDYDSSSSGFDYYATHLTSTYASVGSRLCFKTRELATYIGKQFIALYNDYLNND